MSRYPKIYRNSKIFKRLLTAILSLVIAVVVLFIALFFGLQKYIVYTSDGIRLEIPFLNDSENSGTP